ncbi:TetR/AcrR family transcriptional regulator [Lentzea sp. NPDC051213]|uniref:TetR/AcrR family transcriptional regulator n=1 Tax=Lentzea sp. NPDC051213 TaxID=3364126 RepID=UPI0037A93259
MSGEVKRSYSSPLREQAAASTRLLVRDAGHRLFARDGFVATSIKKIAHEAGVSERTVYTHYRNKVELFQDALNVAIAGDELPVAMRDRPSFEELLRMSSARELIDEAVAANAVILERAGALIMAGIESSGADADMRRISDEGEHAMRANCLALATALIGTGEVRPEYGAERVADVLTTMLSPHVFQLMGWSSSRYQGWLADALRATLLMP